METSQLFINNNQLSGLHYGAGFGELGKLTKAEKAERKRLYRIEKAERKRLALIEKAARKKLNLLMSKKERKRFARAAAKQQEVLKRATGFIGKLNKLGAARPPLTKEEEFSGKPVSRAIFR